MALENLLCFKYLLAKGSNTMYPYTQRERYVARNVVVVVAIFIFVEFKFGFGLVVFGNGGGAVAVDEGY